MRIRTLTCAAALTALAASLLTGCSGTDRDEGGAQRPGPAGTAPGGPGHPTTPEATTPEATRSPTAAGTGPERTSPPTTAGPAPGTPRKALWRPRPGLAWQWQLNGRADPSVDVPVYDIDGFENSAADVARLHRDGRKVICYVNVGAWENFRPDKDAFPRSVLGGTNGWDGERWLDIRRLSVLRPIMERRFDMCRDKGFDAVEPDLLEAYSNRTGFPLTARDQLRYNRMIAEVAHERGLSVGLKNDLPQIPQLVGDFDFAVNEECAQYRECERLTPFVKAGKAVFHVEYVVSADGFCPISRRLGLSSMRKKLELGVWREPC
ncbi:endo alpha-1,4 polygalactosaminidase [Streptomyces sp. NPDC017179]|uniref:endo alpha-1,4 polygalactosaminidase n=1 Tax=Streptomyces sp. NPDC017179 TaxID=3364979 RepID=UPI0037BCF904